jgi:hypothetical protein
MKSFFNRNLVLVVLMVLMMGLIVFGTVSLTGCNSTIPITVSNGPPVPQTKVYTATFNSIGTTHNAPTDTLFDTWNQDGISISAWNLGAPGTNTGVEFFQISGMAISSLGPGTFTVSGGTKTVTLSGSGGYYDYATGGVNWTSFSCTWTGADLSGNPVQINMIANY